MAEAEAAESRKIETERIASRNRAGPGAGSDEEAYRYHRALGTVHYGDDVDHDRRAATGNSASTSTGTVASTTTTAAVAAKKGAAEWTNQEDEERQRRGVEREGKTSSSSAFLLSSSLSSSRSQAPPKSSTSLSSPSPPPSSSSSSTTTTVAAATSSTTATTTTFTSFAGVKKGTTSSTGRGSGNKPGGDPSGLTHQGVDLDLPDLTPGVLYRLFLLHIEREVRRRVKEAGGDARALLHGGPHGGTHGRGYRTGRGGGGGGGGGRYHNDDDGDDDGDGDGDDDGDGDGDTDTHELEVCITPHLHHHHPPTLVYLPAYHINYSLGVVDNVHGESVPDEFEAMVAATCPSTSTSSRSPSLPTVVAERHLCGTKVATLGSATTAALGYILLLLTGGEGVSTTSTWSPTTVTTATTSWDMWLSSLSPSTLGSGFWTHPELLLAAVVAGVLARSQARSYTHANRQRSDTSRLRAEARSETGYARPRSRPDLSWVSDPDAPSGVRLDYGDGLGSEADIRAVRRAEGVEWRRWAESHRWNWVGSDRRRCGESIYRQQQHRRLARARYVRQLAAELWTDREREHAGTWGGAKSGVVGDVLGYYRDLGLPQGARATMTEIKEAYRRAVMECHPDRLRHEGVVGEKGGTSPSRPMVEVGGSQGWSSSSSTTTSSSSRELRFQRVVRAYAVLRNEEKRREYDDGRPVFDR